jgi:DNA-binding MarR family transcriptional regulator
VADRSSGIRELDQRIPFLLSQLGTYVSDDFKRRLAPLDVHPRTNAVLVALAGADGQSQRQLSARLGLHRNVMVSLIDTLEEQGLVERKPHPDDRRAFAVTLTDKAHELLPALEEQSHAMEGEVTAALTPDERAALLDMLRRVSASLGLSPGVHPRLAESPY